MGTQLLNLPLDITWRRLAFSRDMVDTSFGDLELPPKWRSSMAIYQYVVPEEQSEEAYPDSRIIYLSLSCSVTGWNPSEALRKAVVFGEAGDQVDDLQRSTWEAIQAEGWAEQYWPCLGAIVQLALYPGEEDREVAPDDIPFIVNVEPKKRELYETRSETGEFLSGTSDQVNVRKGTTDTTSTEESDILTGGSASGGYGFGFIEGSASVSGEWGTRKKSVKESVDLTTTDGSRDRRETLAFSTSFNQLYQLLNAYHLGTNRCVFVVAPRPHTATAATGQVDFNLVHGNRELEGIQDFFIVIEVPKRLKGICVQASLDTGHTVWTQSGAMRMRMDDDFDAPGGTEGFAPPDLRPDDDWLPPAGEPDPVFPVPFVQRLVVTRRVVRACASFTDAGQLEASSLGPEPQSEPAVPVVFESAVREGMPERALLGVGQTTSQRLRGQQLVADQRNRFQRRVAQTMLSGFTAGTYKARSFTQTRTARSLAQHTLRRSTLPSAVLIEKGLATKAELKAVGSPRTVGELFVRKARMKDADAAILTTVRSRLVDFVFKSTTG
ncbi:hypothetical protein AB0D91_09755 [Streptomyces canus]|uniref:hypothetical protein n=1 Tax=Streptomyces canus TaxID=58343 RepID=UPI0033E9CBA1